MKALITGSNGTIGNKLKRFLQFSGVEVYTWDRKKTSIFDYHSMEEYIENLKPDIVYHLAIASTSTQVENETWRVNYEWPSELAWICRIHQIKFIFTSSYEVFSDYNNGPFNSFSKPDAFEGFGFEKRMAEERVFYQNPSAIIIRLPLQISRDIKDTGLLKLAYDEMKANGVVKASTNFFPAVSFIDDTVNEIYRISLEYEKGLFMIDSNDGINYYDLLMKVKNIYQKDWVVEKTIDFIYNQTMIDERIKIPKLSEKLEEKEKEVSFRSNKTIALIGNKDVIKLSQIYRTIGYKIGLLYDDDILSTREIAEFAGIENCSSKIEDLFDTEQLIVTNLKYTTVEFLSNFTNKIIILNKFPIINSMETFEKFEEIFKKNKVYLSYIFSEFATATAIREAINMNKIGKINNIFLDIGAKNEFSFKDSFFQIALNPLSFLMLYFDEFKLDYSDYNSDNNNVFAHLCNGTQRLNINFYKLWYEGKKVNIRIIGENGEIKVEGRYTKKDNWNFDPIYINEEQVGQGEYSKEIETVEDLALKDYVEILEKEIHNEVHFEEVYSAEKTFKLFKLFKDMWHHNCKN